MPLYQYTCDLCQRTFTVLVGVTSLSDNNACPHCGSLSASRRIARFTSKRSVDHDMDAPKQNNGEDASAMREWSSALGNAVGQDLGSDFEEYIDSTQNAGGV